MNEYISYLVIRDDEKPMIIKVDQTDKIDRPNQIDDEDWIIDYIEEEYGGFDEIQVISLDGMKYHYLEFDHFNGNE